MSYEKSQSIKNFVRDWSGRGYEKGENQKFWLQFLRDVSGVDKPETYVNFELQVSSGFIDVYLPETRVIIEQKSISVPLDHSVFLQAKKYDDAINFSRKARWIITCNFREFLIYDMDRNKKDSAPVKILLEELPDKFHAFDFLVKPRRNLELEKKLTFDAGFAVRKLYELLQTYYVDPNSAKTFDSLNKLCVRLVFCMYADSAEIFSSYKIFRDYLEANRNIRSALRELFSVLNTDTNSRSDYLSDDLKIFPYVDGGLFNDEEFDFPNFTAKAREILFNELCNLKWRDINPTIFGAVFEHVLNLSEINQKTRAEHGINYTAPENIQKVINPLFMEDLYDKLATATSREDLFALQREIACLKIFDPACGSGNFLTESYILLRELENAILEVLVADGVKFQSVDAAIKVSIEQFFGIEINGFAVAVAKTALWISEIQMRQKTAEILKLESHHFPLKKIPHIIEANALTFDWQKLISSKACNFIISNPPFVGTKGQSAAQKADIVALCPALKPLDYVCGWYFKASKFIHGANIRCAFVSTNSITQGEQVAPLWQNLAVHIDFAYKTFKWYSESSNMAQVHVVIIGFSHAPNPKPKKIFHVEFVKDDDGNRKEIISAETAHNINGYLIDAPNIYIEKRRKPICKVPEIIMGSAMVEDGNYNFTAEELEIFLNGEPAALKYIRPLLGSEEFINGKKRYCLWLKDCPPNELRAMKKVYERVKAVQKFRLSRDRERTRIGADFPKDFLENRQPDSDYILVPKVSSENRRYVPIGFIGAENIAVNTVLIIPSAKLYHFGVLTSSVHNSWMRAVSGRMEMRYQYSATIVYNNFPWCEATVAQERKISAAAQKILSVRAKYPNATLADLYDPTAMPVDLQRAHKENDAAVMAAYGFALDMSEPEIVARLMARYLELTKTP